MATTRFRVLGRLEVELDGRVLELAGRRERTVLAILLLHAGSLVSIEQLIDELWEHDPPRTARQQVYNLLARIRRLLHPAAPEVRVTSREDGYRLDAPRPSIDLLRFLDAIGGAKRHTADGRVREAAGELADAVGLWRGPAFDGLSGRRLRAAAVHLTEQRLSAVERLSGLRLDLDESDLVVTGLLGPVAENPYRESLRANLMSALIRTGRQNEALTVFDQGRRLLAEELGLDPGPRLVELQRLALDAAPPEEPHAETPPEPSRVAPADLGSRPCFLPRDVADFVGREPESAAIRSALEADRDRAVAIVGLWGMGGVGKTSLAVHVAHQLAASFPDGQYFVDLRGFSPGGAPIGAEEALETLLRDSGVPAQDIPAGLDHRSRLWRSRLVDRRVLILIDNAASEEEIRPLFPSTVGSAVILTSRRRLAPREGSRSIRLEPPSAEESRALFELITGADRVEGEQAEVAEVVELCGRLPLAVRIAASLLRDRSAWSAGYLAGRMRPRDDRGRLLRSEGRGIEEIAALACDHLPPPWLRVFALLGGSPCADFDAYACAALAAIPVEEAESALEGLIDNSLLMQREAGRYRFHDLVADYARVLWETDFTPPEQAEARDRLIDHYLRATAEYCAPLAIKPLRFPPSLHAAPRDLARSTDPEDGRRRMETELGNVVAVALDAAAAGRHRAVWQLACLAQPYLKTINYGPIGGPLYDRALDSAKQAGDEHGAGLTLYVSAKIALWQENLQLSHDLILQARAASQRAEDHVAELYEEIHLGTVHFEQLDHKSGRARLARARELALAQADEEALSIIANNLAAVHLQFGEYGQARERLSESLAHSKAAHNHNAQTEATTWANLGHVHHRLGEWAAAADAFHAALRHATSPHQPAAEVYALLGLAQLHRATGNLPNASTACRRALRLARGYNLLQMQCEALVQLGHTRAIGGAWQAAETGYLAALALAETHELGSGVSLALDGLAHASLARGEPTQAARQWRRALLPIPAESVEAAEIRLHQDKEGAPSPIKDCDLCEATQQPAS